MFQRDKMDYKNILEGTRQFFQGLPLSSHTQPPPPTTGTGPPPPLLPEREAPGATPHHHLLLGNTAISSNNRSPSTPPNPPSNSSSVITPNTNFSPTSGLKVQGHRSPSINQIGGGHSTSSHLNHTQPHPHPNQMSHNHNSLSGSNKHSNFPQKVYKRFIGKFKEIQIEIFIYGMFSMFVCLLLILRIT